MQYILTLLLTLTYLYANSLTKLQNYKTAHPAITYSSQNTLNTQSSMQKTNQLIISFKNIEQTDFLYLYEEYQLDTLFCFAKQICLFQNNSDLSQQELIDILQQDPNIIRIKEYQQYDMKPF